MDNNKFWQEYKAKCLEKRLPVLHENEEEFSKAMTEPPKPFSTDDITSLSTRKHVDFGKRDRLLDGLLEIDDENIGEVEEDTMPKHVKLERCKECGEMKEDSAFGHNRDGSLKKICKACHGKKISAARKGNSDTSKDEPTPQTKEPKVMRYETVKPLIDEGKIFIPAAKPFLGIDASHSDASDAIAFGLQVPLLKEHKPLKAMSEEALRNLLRLAFLAGVESVNAPAPEELKQETAMELLNDVITQCKRART